MTKYLRVCIYCGNLALERDHPVARSSRASNHPRFGGDYSHIQTVPACTECNHILGNIPISDIRDRARFVFEKLYERGASQDRIEWCRKIALLD
jgi:hypothetical protein